MSDAETFRQYAEDCRRIAKTLNGKDSEMLMRIAKAWAARAREVEDGQNKFKQS